MPKGGLCTAFSKSLFGEGPDKDTKGMDRLRREFENAPELQKHKMQLGRVVDHLIEDVFGVAPEEISYIIPTKGRVRTFGRRLNKVKAAMIKGRVAGKMAELFYTPEGHGERAPILTKLLQDYIEISHHYKGSEYKHNSKYKELVSQLGIVSAARKLAETEGGSDRVNMLKASKQISNAEAKMKFYTQEIARGEDKYIPELRLVADSLATLYMKGEGAVLKEVVQIVETELPELQRQLDIQYHKKVGESAGKYKEVAKAAKYKAINNLEKITKDPNMQHAIKGYIDLMGDMHGVLRAGTSEFIRTTLATVKGTPNEKLFKDLESKIWDKLGINPTGDAIDEFYYPHYEVTLNAPMLTGLMEHMGRINDSIRPDIELDGSGVREALDNFNSFLSPHAKQRKLGTAEKLDYSMNFLANAKRYVDEIDRFNYVTHLDGARQKMLKEAIDIYRSGSDLNGYGNQVAKMIVELHKAATGTQKIENQNIQSILDTVLALEFTSKLGFNLRTAVRNASQSLLNITEFGFHALRQSNKWYKNNDKMSDEVLIYLKNSGILFSDYAPELIEALDTGSRITQKIDMGDGHILEYKNPSGLSIGKVAKGAKWAAGKSGIFMRAIENKNRIATFKVAFYKEYTDRINSPKWVAAERRRLQLKDNVNPQAIGTQKGEATDSSIIDRSAFEMATKAALKKTVALHFDYSNFSRSKFMRTPTGKLMFMFQHYAYKFFELNKRYVQEAGDDIMAGELTGDRAWRAYRMALVYFATPAAAEAVTNISWGKLIEHSTANTLKQMFSLFSGDKTEIEKAFYGSGPVVGGLGMPIISDLLKVGEMAELYKMNPASIAAVAVGYENYAKATGDKRFYDSLRLLNSFVGRTIYHTAPLFFTGSFGMAAQTELGLYPKGKKHREDLKKRLPRSKQNALEELITMAKEHKKRALKPLE